MDDRARLAQARVDEAFQTVYQIAQRALARAEKAEADRDAIAQERDYVRDTWPEHAALVAAVERLRARLEEAHAALAQAPHPLLRHAARLYRDFWAMRVAALGGTENGREGAQDGT